jgi:D-beta-D-heptose 7-phosphate kinase/D-beta-D-heptose 1-phosphate adenosyltransferase
MKTRIAEFANKHIVVVGDLMLDEFVRGDVRRISPEAPVPVLEVHSRDVRLGGAANAAANVAALGGRATLVGLTGDDTAGDHFGQLCEKRGLGTVVVRDNSRPTTQKTRFVARGQQVLRIDHETRVQPSQAVLERLLAAITNIAADADGFIISDYAKGVIHPEVAKTVVTAARGRPVVSDPKVRDLGVYAGSTVMTPNHAELEAAVNAEIEGNEAVVAAMRALLPRLGGSALVVTRGAAGMTLLEPGRDAFHFHATAKSVFDVTGAGDTVVATLALALASGISLRDAVVAASAAAGVVVSREGTATLSRDELATALGELGH